MNEKARAKHFNGDEFLIQIEAMAFADASKRVITGDETDKYYYDLRGLRQDGTVPYKLLKQGVKQQVARTLYYREK